MSHHHPDAHGRMFGASEQADSAGQPWAGRQFTENSFAQDDGQTPLHVREPLATFLSDRGRYVELVRAMAESRVLVPLIAHAGEEGVNEQGLRVDKTQELSIVTVQGPDARTVLPVFTSVRAMQQWNPEARPVPVEMVRVALAAAEEDTELVVVNATTIEEFTIRRPALWAIAKQETADWVPSWASQAVLDEFVRIASVYPEVSGLQLVNGDPEARLFGPELIVVLALKPGLERAVVDALIQALTAAWAESQLIAEQVDSMSLKLVAAQ